MLTDSDTGKFEWTDRQGNEWITDNVIKKWVDQRYPDVGMAYFYYKDRGFILKRDVGKMKTIDQTRDGRERLWLLLSLNLDWVIYPAAILFGLGLGAFLALL